jgi:hypothetical protein
MSTSNQAAPPQLSPDGYWRWDGFTWHPTGAPLPGEPLRSRARPDGLAITALVLSVFGGILLSALCAYESQRQAKKRHLKPSLVSVWAVAISLAWVGVVVLIVLSVAVTGGGS